MSGHYKEPVLSGDYSKWGDYVHLCLPSGIGDISWIYSKIKHLKQKLGRDVRVSVAGDPPLRSAEFVQMLPDVTWSGYLEDRDSWIVHTQSIPSTWPVQIGLALWHKPFIQNLSANFHLEQGRPIADWLPDLPVDYHYQINIPSNCHQIASSLLPHRQQMTYAVYVSNRGKEAQRAGGWSLWSTEQWIEFLDKIGQLPQLGKPRFVFLGAEYDRDKTELVMHGLAQRGHETVGVIAQPLGVALACLQRSNYMFSFPSGLGIVANVLQIPCLMLLPWMLKNLENAYADPTDLANQRYRVWSNPTPEEAYTWFSERAMWMALSHLIR